MIAGRVLDPRLMWDAAEAGTKAVVSPLRCGNFPRTRTDPSHSGW